MVQEREKMATKTQRQKTTRRGGGAGGEEKGEGGDVKVVGKGRKAAMKIEDRHSSLVTGKRERLRSRMDDDWPILHEGEDAR